MSGDEDVGRHDENLDLIDLWDIVWAERRIVGSILAVSVLFGVIYAMLATEQFRARTLLAPVADDSRSGLSARIGGIASLAGINLGAGASASSEAIAILQSHDFLQAFIQENDLRDTLLEATEGWWSVGMGGEESDLREAVEIFNADVLEVTQNAETGLVTVTVRWLSAELAASWANALVTRLNAHMQNRALEVAEGNIAFLQQELARTDVATLRLSIGNLLEQELQKLMLARGRDEYVFRVLDSAQPPRLRNSPKRKLIVVLSLALGSIASIVIAFMKYLGRVARSRPKVTHPHPLTAGG